jgi:hypothetical protein
MNEYKFLAGKPERRYQLEDLDVDGMIIIKWD